MSVIMCGCQEIEIQKTHLLHVPDVKVLTGTVKRENNTKPEVRILMSDLYSSRISDI
jgi:hypothetical protein